MIPLACFVLAQTSGFTDPNAVQKQIGLCINALGFEKPLEGPKYVVKMKDKWVIAWGPFEAELANRGVLTSFKLVNQKYKLSKTNHFPGTSNTTGLQNYLTHLCNAAGMLHPTTSQKLSFTKSGKATASTSSYVAMQYKSFKLELSARDDSGETNRLCSIQCSAIDGAVSDYRLDRSEFALDSTRIVGTFKLKK